MFMDTHPKINKFLEFRRSVDRGWGGVQQQNPSKLEVLKSQSVKVSNSEANPECPLSETYVHRLAMVQKF
jgi:hypothetical protein